MWFGLGWLALEVDVDSHKSEPCLFLCRQHHSQSHSYPILQHLISCPSSHPCHCLLLWRQQHLPATTSFSAPPLSVPLFTASWKRAHLEGLTYAHFFCALTSFLAWVSLFPCLTHHFRIFQLPIVLHYCLYFSHLLTSDQLAASPLNQVVCFPQILTSRKKKNQSMMIISGSAISIGADLMKCCLQRLSAKHPCTRVPVSVCFKI